MVRPSESVTSVSRAMTLGTSMDVPPGTTGFRVYEAGDGALLVSDMPFLSYQASAQDAIRHAGRMLKAGAHAVKIEGGLVMTPIVRALRAVGIPVMGHIGMTPQSVNVFGGYKIQGRQATAQRTMLSDARALERAGAFAIVLECVPAALGKKISKAVRIPIIGIGAGPSCDGQILVIDDLLGLTPPPYPRFVKRYADLRGTIKRAARAYAKDVRSGLYPDQSQSYS